ncbi:nitroreductase [Aspergillus eucalypticola CBS 122712]|uniref:Nitroreductase n=1 Tax=Aspergillus eucalypticola (strain CBS 122712 / IBT 29274) TaxID=1448314 RepID=A0A317WCU8_ASPEC|nr:nitroreductase [Aspergillus eucalypticola CBS 122712]PWY84356.1 nitroreductase [Aspergillus eucalypticola CBS 122712]
MTKTISRLAEARYRDSESCTFPLPTDPSNPPTSALSTILSHRSCRAFLPFKLPEGTLETLITAAQSGSTSSLLQTWDVIAIQDPEHKSNIATLAADQDFIRQAPLFLVFCPNLRRLKNLSEQYDHQDSPVLDNMNMFIMSTVDSAIAAQNVAIAAESLGLGICYVGALRHNADEVCKLLNLPPLTWGVFGMAVGYPDTENRRSGRRIKPRLPMREVLHMERWNEEGQKDNVASYDKALGTFYEEESKFGRKAWGEFVAGRVASQAQGGWVNIRKVIEKQGFKLE